MKNIFFIPLFVAAAALFAACDDSDKLENSIDFSSPYVIADNPSDPIQHHRYEIYKKYAVPVFFNDTISQTLIGKNYDGTNLYRYETLDFNWSFSSYDKSTVYDIEYIEEPESQEAALKFVDEFLSQTSQPMMPFSIFLPANFTIIASTGTTKPSYWSGFRTLVIPKAMEVEEEKLEAFTTEVIRSMVKDRILANNTVVSQFGEVSEKNKWYDKKWVDLGCEWGVTHAGTFWKPSELYTEAGIKKHLSQWWSSGVSTMEEFEAERAIVFQQIGRFGFISGDLKWSRDQTYSPGNVTYDLTEYINQILSLGSEEFLQRYGASPLVLKKYNIITDYMKNELGVKF